jgi:hypothetical protein
MNTLVLPNPSAIVLLAAVPALVPATVSSQVPAPSSDLYVATTGSDANSGTQSAPFKTILKASQVAKPGTMVHVATGTYPGGFYTKANGTASARISYVSDVRGGAKIVPPANSTITVAWWNMGNYVDIVGFNVDGTSYQGGQKWYTGIATQGSYTVVKDNYVHNFATTADTCTANGGSGINSDNSAGGTNNKIIGNVVHHIGSTGCISIHGIYAVASGNVTNNLVYQIGNAGIVSWHAASDITIANNTITNNGFGIIVGNSTTLADYINVSNNIVFNNAKGIAEEGNIGTHNTYTNNLVYQNGTLNWSLNNAHSGDIQDDPQFVDAGNGDFRLKSTSPAINKGSPVYAPSTDLAGAVRPPGGGIDLGALQYKGD